MLKCKVLGINGVDHAIRGMRNPMNSWNKIDSMWTDCDGCDWSNRENIIDDGMSCFVIGENDQKLMKSLFKGGTEHRKYLRMIQVYVDITAPLYWWKEFDTYKVGTVCNSCSTMHKIHSKEFVLEDFSIEHLRSDGLFGDSIDALIHTINIMNFWRERFNESDEARQDYFEQNGYYEVPSKHDCWYQMIQLLPSSYNQKRTVMLNYEVVVNIIRQREHHKLDEWHQLVDTFRQLPMIETLLES